MRIHVTIHGGPETLYSARVVLNIPAECGKYVTIYPTQGEGVGSIHTILVREIEESADVMMLHADLEDPFDFAKLCREGWGTKQKQFLLAPHA